MTIFTERDLQTELASNRPLEFYLAVLNNDVKKVQKLLDQNRSTIDVNSRFTDVTRRNHLDLFPIHLAASKGYIEMMRLFIQTYNCDVDVTTSTLKRTPAHFTVLRRRIDCLKLLIQAGCSLDVNDTFGNHPIHYAAEDGECEILTLLLRRKVPANAQDITLKTPLMKAARNGRIHAGIHVVRRLLDFKCALNMKDGNGDTALHFAARSGHTAVVTCLIRAGANLDLINCLHQTPLLVAVRNQRREVARALVLAGCDVNLQEKSTWATALHIAIRKRYTTLIKTLLNHGADQSLMDIKRESPAYYPIANNEFDMVVFLARNNFNFDQLGLIQYSESGCYRESLLYAAVTRHSGSDTHRLVHYLNCAYTPIDNSLFVGSKMTHPIQEHEQETRSPIPPSLQSIMSSTVSSAAYTPLYNGHVANSSMFNRQNNTADMINRLPPPPPRALRRSSSTRVLHSSTLSITSGGSNSATNGLLYVPPPTEILCSFPSLKRLCRKRIRLCISGKDVPKAILDLPVPRVIQGYLHLEDLFPETSLYDKDYKTTEEIVTLETQCSSSA